MFKEGDRVRAIVDHPDSNPNIKRYDEGIIVALDVINRKAGIRWDNFVGGHSVGDRCEQGHGWWTLYTEIERIQQGFEFDTNNFLDLL